MSLVPKSPFLYYIYLAGYFENVYRKVDLSRPTAFLFSATDGKVKNGHEVIRMARL